MKKFVKTTAGKTVLFVLCIVSLGTLLLSSLAAAFLFEEDFYSRDKEAIYADIIDHRLDSDLYELVCSGYSDPDNPIRDDKGNLAYQICDETGRVVCASASVSSISLFDGTKSYYLNIDDEGNVDVFNDSFAVEADLKEWKTCTVYYSILKGTGRVDFYSFASTLFEIAYTLRYGLYGIILLSVLLLIGTFVTLVNVAGRTNEDDGLHPGPLNSVPFDLLCAIAFGCFGIYGYICDSFPLSSSMLLVMILLGFLLGANGLLGLCMSLACRIKQKTLLKKSFCWWAIRNCLDLLRWCWNLCKRILKGMLSFFRQIPLVWKTAVILLGFCLIEGVVLANSYSDYYISFWALRNLILIPAILYLAMCMRRLQKGGEALAAGDLSYHIDTKHMYYDLKKHGEDLNSIAKGMTIAVEERLKSERMKTELITNVSHDIKTPLTSIISYADLISKEPVKNKKIKEYSEVLLRQSDRLKRLLEDLVEASKASTGNLEVLLQPCDANVFLSQAAGEYEDKLKQSDLALICNDPGKEIMIMADGRRMWRIFDNLMNNICKYAQPGTRVYLSLNEEEGKAVFTFRNTSRDALNISEEELMERFTRGDASRHTEGNGLGLSIARSMAQLQNGDLHLTIDGDLFKAILSFPTI